MDRQRDGQTDGQMDIHTYRQTKDRKTVADKKTDRDRKGGRERQLLDFLLALPSKFRQSQQQ